MMKRPISLFAFATIALCAPAALSAAEYTDLVDAADDFDDLDPSTFDAFDLHLEPTFQFHYERAQIAREAPCVAEAPGASERAVRDNARLIVDADRCPSARVVTDEELDYVGTRAELGVALRIGLYKDLELRIKAPYVFASTRQIGYAEGVGPRSSSVDPASRCEANEAGRCIEREAIATFSDQRGGLGAEAARFDEFAAHRFFDAGADETYTRSGFAEPSVGLHWAIFNDERDPTKATLLVGADYTMPIVPIQEADNLHVGRGMHEFAFALATSKRFDWIEPYLGASYNLPIASERSPIGQIDTRNEGQTFTRPPQSAQFDLGAEFIPYADAGSGQRYGIDARFSFGYVSEGRDYSPLFDHLGKSACNGRSIAEISPRFEGGALQNPDELACSWIVERPSNAPGRPAYDLDRVAQDDPSAPFRTDAITTVQGYATLRGQLGIYVQPRDTFQLKGVVALEHQQEHFLTNARTGRDADDRDEVSPDRTVDLEGEDAALERNPVYNRAYDAPGSRFLIRALRRWSFSVTAALQF